MQKYPNEIQFALTPTFCVVSALMFLVLPIRWVLSWFAASLIHELCHYSTLTLLRIPVYSVTISGGGALMHTGPMGYWEEFICAMSGPVGGLVILFFARQLPLVAVCGFMQSLYNLLPIYPLDGGRAVKCLLMGLIKEPLGSRIFQYTQIITVILLLAVCIFAIFILNFKYIPAAVAVILIFKMKSLKTTCKPWLQRVQ